MRAIYRRGRQNQTGDFGNFPQLRRIFEREDGLTAELLGLRGSVRSHENSINISGRLRKIWAGDGVGGGAAGSRAEKSLQPDAISVQEHSGHSRGATCSAFRRPVLQEFVNCGDFFVVIDFKTAINCLMPQRNSRFRWECGSRFPNVRLPMFRFRRSIQELFL